MVLLFNLLKFHKNGGDGDEVLGFWFHTNYLRKFSNTIEDLEIPHLSISCPEWLAEDDLTSFCRPFQRSPSPTRRAWKRWATRRKVRPKRLDPLASAMEVSAGKIIENVGSASHVWLRVGMGRGFLRFDQHLMRSLFFVKMEDLASFFSFPIALKWEDLEGRSWVVSFSATSAPAKWKTWGFSMEKTWGFPMEKHWVFLEVGAPQNQQNPLVSCWNHFSQALASSTYRASAERARGAQWKRGLWEPIFFCLFQCLDSDISSIFQW